MSLMMFYERRTEDVTVSFICDHPFPSHVHDEAEVVCVTAGTLVLTVAGMRREMFPGDIVLIFPAVPHSYDEVSDDIEGLTWIFRSDVIPEFSRNFRTMLPCNLFLSPKEQAPELRQIIRHLQTLSEAELVPLKTGYLHLFLSYVFARLDMQPLDKNAQPNLIYQVLNYIAEHFTEPLSLESTAHALGISRIHLSHIFSQRLHVSFRQHINSLRVSKACSLLRDTNISIAEIAYMCGYGNPRTFHRAFVAQRNIAPNQYRAQVTKHQGEKTEPVSELFPPEEE